MSDASFSGDVQLPPCPDCGEPYAYAQGVLLVCPCAASNGPPTRPTAPANHPASWATRSAMSWQMATP